MTRSTRMFKFEFDKNSNIAIFVNYMRIRSWQKSWSDSFNLWYVHLQWSAHILLQSFYFWTLTTKCYVGMKIKNGFHSEKKRKWFHSVHRSTRPDNEVGHQAIKTVKYGNWFIQRLLWTKNYVSIDQPFISIVTFPMLEGFNLQFTWNFSVFQQTHQISSIKLL